MAVPGLAQLPLADLRALFGTLKKYDSAFTAEAKQQLQVEQRGLAMAHHRQGFSPSSWRRKGPLSALER